MTWKPIPASSTRIITTGVDNVCNVAVLINSGVGKKTGPMPPVCKGSNPSEIDVIGGAIFGTGMQADTTLGNWPRNCVCVRDEEIAILARVSQFEKQNKKRVVRKKDFLFLFQRTVVCRMRS